ncbi:DUF4382 domain-containing protein [Litoribrevibacter albus]|uniref:DUF4382 domain-containing protein n=1 Tax=Litoribrevibacter albus TaxID=1473156 RepID=A0AA37W935_9GAMM|nr:DUF4382 domain-containing protein [Litoribrevibacter albus]GLQ32759.1 hypothetical protein GCM10007876_32380 [Litoribrevibacter albus]
MSAIKYLPLLAVLPLAVTGCGGGSSSSSSEKGSFSLSVTDAPVDDAENVVVEFTGVELKPADGESITITFDTPKTIDLLAQQNGSSAELLSDQSLEAGNYNWIRLAVNAEEDNVMDSYIQIGGTQYELDIPSGSQSGLKLNSGFTITASGNANYTIDFDLRKSVVLANGDYKLRPSLRLVDDTEVGTISGEVDANVIAAQCADANTYSGVVYVFSGAGVTPDDLDGTDPEPLSSASVNFSEEGGVYSYTAAFLEAGDYTLSYTCDADDSEVDEVLTFNGTSDVTLAAGATETLNF